MYSPNNRNEREELYKNLKDVVAIHKTKTNIMGGDFNFTETIGTRDRLYTRGLQRLAKKRVQFFNNSPEWTEIKQTLQITDTLDSINTNNNFYTFAAQHSFGRLDRFYISRNKSDLINTLK